MNYDIYTNSSFLIRNRTDFLAALLAVAIFLFHSSYRVPIGMN